MSLFLSLESHYVRNFALTHHLQNCLKLFFFEFSKIIYIQSSSVVYLAAFILIRNTFFPNVYLFVFWLSIQCKSNKWAVHRIVIYTHRISFINDLQRHFSLQTTNFPLHFGNKLNFTVLYFRDADHQRVDCWRFTYIANVQLRSSADPYPSAAGTRCIVLRTIAAASDAQHWLPVSRLRLLRRLDGVVFYPRRAGAVKNKHRWRDGGVFGEHV